MFFFFWSVVLTKIFYYLVLLHWLICFINMYQAPALHQALCCLWGKVISWIRNEELTGWNHLPWSMRVSSLLIVWLEIKHSDFSEVLRHFMRLVGAMEHFDPFYQQQRSLKICYAVPSAQCLSCLSCLAMLWLYQTLFCELGFMPGVILQPSCLYHCLSSSQRHLQSLCDW